LTGADAGLDDIGGLSRQLTPQRFR
jgi:hypothetical protein